MSNAHAVVKRGEVRKGQSHSPSSNALERLDSFRSSPLPGTYLCMAMLALAIILGGGGTVNPQTETALQILTVFLLIPFVASTQWQRGLGKMQAPAWILAGLVLVIPVLQLVPLPPSVWHALPGRALEIESLKLVHAENAWMPLTMAPARTFASLLALIVPILLMLHVSRMPLRERSWLCAVIVAGGAASLALGVFQLSHTGGLDWSLYSEFSEGFLVGFQANRNAEADILLIAMLAMGVSVTVRLHDGRPHAMTWTFLMMGLIAFFVGLFMTGSRTGIGLAIPALAVLGVLLWPLLRKQTSAKRWLLGGAATAVISGALLLQLQSTQKVIARFSLSNEARWDLWVDTWYAIKQVWPFGSGIGTIVPMLEAAERLDMVDTTRPVRAHNDWLEWILEAGLPGVVVLGLVALFVVVLLVRAWSAGRGSKGDPIYRAQVIFAGGVLLVEGLHSIDDYPMRSMSLAALAAVAVGFLLFPAASQREQE